MAKKLTKGEMIGIAATIGIGLLTLWLMNSQSGDGVASADNPDTYYLTSNIPNAGDANNPGLNFGGINVSNGCGCDSTDYTTAAGIAMQTASNNALAAIVGSLPPYITANVNTNGNYISANSPPPVVGV